MKYPPLRYNLREVLFMRRVAIHFNPAIGSLNASQVLAYFGLTPDGEEFVWTPR